MNATEPTFTYDQARFTAAQNERLAEAFRFAREAHAPQVRRSGEPYIIHPIAVAETVAGWGFDDDTIAAALMHDVVEDTDVTLEDIGARFGDNVARLVDGVTKLSVIEAMPSPDAASARLEASNENLRKLLLATARDSRVIIIKLADRLHNLRTLGHHRLERRAPIAKESLDIYAPIADRLGMGQLKAEIEDLSFRYWQPEAFASLSTQMSEVSKRSERYLATVKHKLRGYLADGGLKPESIEGRQKHLYSIYKKLVKVGDLDKMYDLFAIRVIVPDVASCYQALGIIHQHYKPLIYRIKDYIAVPKPNGYQSLHTTVFAEDGRIIEIQIRTPAMHEEAERGLSAHFYYGAAKASSAYASGQSASTVPSKLSWVKELSTLQSESASGQEFVDAARIELFRDRIFVFSPQGDLYDLPEGSTPVDFAFAVHSGLGLRTMGARVNGRMVTLDRPLENRDMVEIITRREPAPNRDWLGFVTTPAARNRIRAWFRAKSRDANVASGKALLEAELRVLGIARIDDVPAAAVAGALDSLHLRGLDDLLAAVGEGGLGVIQAVRRLVPDAGRPQSAPRVARAETTGNVLFSGSQAELPYQLAACCGPVFPQPIVGYVTRGSGVTVHALNCSNLPRDADRYVACHWETLEDTPKRLVCRLELVAFNRIGLIRDVTGVVSAARLNIGSMATRELDDVRSAVAFALEVPDLFALAAVMRRLERVPGIERVTRV